MYTQVHAYTHNNIDMHAHTPPMKIVNAGHIVFPTYIEKIYSETFLLFKQLKLEKKWFKYWINSCEFKVSYSSVK